MALRIENKKIVGEIDNLQDKLNGELPVTRLELLVLISSWGRDLTFFTKDNTLIESSGFNKCYDLSKLDTSKITNMSYLFLNSSFDGDISKWDVSNVTNMTYMFSNTKNFNSDIGNWDVSNVTNMICMFYKAKLFNKGINSWDISNVKNIYSMFNGTISFNQPLNNWNTSKVTNMSYIFMNTKKFNQDISSWDISNVTNIEYMFLNAINFNQNIFNWDFSNVKKMQCMFQQAKKIINKYNNGEDLPFKTDDIKEWIINNSERINMIDLKDKHGDEIDNFFSKCSLIKNNNLLTECNKQSSNRMQQAIHCL